MKFGKMKLDKPLPLPHVVPEEGKQEKIASEGQEKAHTNIIPDSDSIM